VLRSRISWRTTLIKMLRIFAYMGLFLSLSGSGLNFLSAGCFSKSHRGETLSIYNNAITLIIKDGTHLKFGGFGVIIS